MNGRFSFHTRFYTRFGVLFSARRFCNSELCIHFFARPAAFGGFVRKPGPTLFGLDSIRVPGVHVTAGHLAHLRGKLCRKVEVYPAEEAVEGRIHDLLGTVHLRVHYMTVCSIGVHIYAVAYEVLEHLLWHVIEIRDKATGREYV